MQAKQVPSPRPSDIVDLLRGDILTGRIADGVRLTEAELTKRYGAGRGPVREAVQRLAMQGLLETRPNRGAVVAPRASKGVRALIVPIRRTLEAYALQELFEDLNTSDFERWDQILLQMRTACETGDLHAIAETDIAFHRHLMQRLGQPDLLAIWELLVGRIRSHFRCTQRQRVQDLMEIHSEHMAIVQSFRSDSVDSAVKLLRSKIN